ASCFSSAPRILPPSFPDSKQQMRENDSKMQTKSIFQQTARKLDRRSVNRQRQRMPFFPDLEFPEILQRILLFGA
ncbi:MAG: hypothetical protein ABSG54_16995, partial [Terriglobia bacterium]